MTQKKKFLEQMEPVNRRCQMVTEFLESVRPDIIHEVVPISDMYGPSRSDPDLQCIVVSHETRGGADLGLTPVPPLVHSLPPP